VTTPSVLKGADFMITIKGALGNPAKIIDLGAEKVFIYHDMRIVFNNGKVADV
jgi:hypothetical protein